MISVYDHADGVRIEDSKTRESIVVSTYDAGEIHRQLSMYCKERTSPDIDTPCECKGEEYGKESEYVDGVVSKGGEDHIPNT